MTDEASHDELQEVINRRLATGQSTQLEIDLSQHMKQLKVLYSLVNRRVISWGLGLPESTIAAISKENPRYPREDFDDFGIRMIEQKKLVIERELGVSRTLA